MPKDEPDGVSTYIRWLYTRVLFTSESVETNVEWGRLTSAYIFGDKILDSDYKDAAIDGLIPKLSEQKSYPIQKTRKIYKNTTSGDLARRLWVDWFAYAKNSEWMDTARKSSLYQSLPPQSRLDIYKAWAIKPPCEIGTCIYHIYGQNCCYKNRPFPSR